jgi:large subunit ribosomal protein L18
MLTKKEQRLRRARQTRIRIATQGTARLTVNRTNLHIYAALISDDGSKVLASASTAEPTCARNSAARARAPTSPPPSSGQAIAERPRPPASRRSPSTAPAFAYHGRVKALAEAAREAGLQF